METTAATGQLTSMKQAMDRIPGLRQGLLLLAIAGSVALGVVAALWSINPVYTPLAQTVSDPAAAAVVLKNAGIKVSDRGDRLLVESGRAGEAQSLLRDQNLIATSPGCESVLEQPSGMGVVTMERERIQHRCMLQAELAQLITEMRPVRSARVVIGSGKEQVFLRDRTPTKASVFVELFPGVSADEALVAAIVNTVSNGVPGLAPANITVNDQHGRVLTSMSDPGMSLTMQQMKIQQRMEMEKERKIQQQLDRYVGMGNYTATVTADVDFTTTEETSRTLSEPQLIGQSVTVTERSGGGANAEGIPGAISNSPPAAPPAEGAGTGGSDAAAPPSINRSEKRTENLATGETYRRVEKPAPRITRLAIAVALNDALLAPPEAPAPEGDGDGEAATDTAATNRIALEEADLATIEQLIRSAVGFDEARGDTISIAAMPFRSTELAPPPPPPWWENTFLVDIARQALGALFVLVLFFTTVRPMISRLLAPTTPALPDSEAYARAALTADADDEEDRERQQAIEQQDKITAARQLASQDPDRVARLLHEWMAEA
jgi:flagellar M-ring protein FliF